MSLFEYSEGEKSEVPLEPLNQTNVYEYIAHNGILSGPMLQAYISGMKAMCSLVTSLGYAEKDPNSYTVKVKELIDQKSVFCDQTNQDLLMSSLPDAAKIKKLLQQ